jgi:hypothetical protein
MNYFGLSANIIDAIFMVVGKTGKFLNARQNRICFLFDGTCLSYWVFMDIQRGLYSQAVSALISMGICVYGFRKWADKK